MKKILVAVDGSAPALHAAQTAVELASSSGGEVTLVYVVPQLMMPAEVPFTMGQWAEEAAKTGEAILAHTAAELKRPELRKLCLTGSAAEAIADLADAEQADMVVVGSKGRGAVSRVLLGSTTDRLVHICRRPVLVVR